GGFAVLAFLSEGLLNALQLVAKAVQALGDAGLRHHGVFAQATANIIGVALHVARQFLLLHFAERFAQLAGRFALSAGQISDGVLHLLFEVFEAIDFGLAAIGKLPGLLLVGPVLGI